VCVCVCSVCLVVSMMERIQNWKVKQASGTVTVTEGQAVSLRCSYEAQYSIYTYWYIQHPGQPLKLLLTEYENYGQGFHATHHKRDKNGTYNLEKEASQLKDSAVYFCAIRDTMRETSQKQEQRIKHRDRGILHFWHLHFKILLKAENIS
uniref:Ig-like domain-containing protein n=1 Tax=Pseudonaja textilis TaxID=8673 RepID=A0A670ZG73_PSETE